MEIRSILMMLAVLCACATVASADSMFFNDGRYYEVPKLIEQEKDLLAVFPHGTVTISKNLVKEFFIEEAGGEIKPKDENEAEKIARGLVPFEGKWIPKARRNQILEKRNEEAIAQLEEYRRHQKWRDRYQKDTKHFEFEFTVPEAVGEQYMEMFEVYYKVFAKDWRIKQPKGKKLKVCFYNNADDFRRIGNVSRGVLGYFRFVDPIELNFFYARRDERLTLDVLFHELNHYLFYLYTANNYQLAPWVEEGLAEYYGASQWDPQTGKMSVGHLQEGRLVRLMDEIDGGQMQSLEGLMREASINATQYAWSWSFCHMLMENPKYKSKFKKYIDKMAKGKAEREPNPRNMNFQWVRRDYAIAQFLKMLGFKSLEDAQAQWYDYIKGLQVESARGYHGAALFCVQWNRPLRATKYFKQAIDRYSSNPATYEAFGELLIDDDKARDAIGILEQGIKLDPMNPYFYKKLGKAYRKLGGKENLEKGKNLQLLAIDMDRHDNSLLSNLDSEVLAEVE